MVSLLRGMGYSASVADVMKARTARAIAAGLASAADVSISQEPIEGAVEDTVILGFFRDWDLPNPDYFNQSLFEKRGGADAPSGDLRQ